MIDPDTWVSSYGGLCPKGQEGGVWPYLHLMASLPGNILLQQQRFNPCILGSSTRVASWCPWKEGYRRWHIGYDPGVHIAKKKGPLGRRMSPGVRTYP